MFVGLAGLAVAGNGDDHVSDLLDRIERFGGRRGRRLRKRPRGRGRAAVRRRRVTGRARRERRPARGGSPARTRTPGEPAKLAVRAAPGQPLRQGPEGRHVRTSTPYHREQYPGDEEWFIGKTDPEIYDSELAAETHADDLRVIEGGESIVEKVEFDPADEEWLLTSKVPWRDEDGDVRGLIGISPVRHRAEGARGGAARDETETRTRTGRDENRDLRLEPGDGRSRLERDVRADAGDRTGHLRGDVRRLRTAGSPGRRVANRRGSRQGLSRTTNCSWRSSGYGTRTDGGSGSTPAAGSSSTRGTPADGRDQPRHHRAQATRTAVTALQGYTDDVLDALDDVFYVLDSNGNLQRWNESMGR